ncbi:MAG TPA: hypothetical protein VGC80_17625 [Acetobacteraceae bacterium]
MADDTLIPTDLADVAQSLAFALRYEGRKRVHHADDFMARIAGERLAEHLKRSGFVVMKRPPARASSVSTGPDPAQG